MQSCNVLFASCCVGATLCKGLNRGFGTLSAASLAFLVEFVVHNSGHVFRAVFIAASVFIVGNILCFKIFLCV